MSNDTKVLVVEDDREINDLIARYLEEHGFVVVQSFDGRDVDAQVGDVDLMVLDINLPADDGFEICVRLRRTSKLPIIMLTSKAEDVDRILGLEIGADDYMIKPFNPRELVARIRAVLRRSEVAPTPARWLGFSAWTVDRVERRVFNPAGAEVSLSEMEIELLLIFCDSGGAVLTRQRLLELTHGSAWTATERSVDIAISRLRRKIEPDPRNPTLIRTVPSRGYLFAASGERRDAR